MDKALHIEFSSSIKNLTVINESFDKGILRIAYVGKNHNGSDIRKDTFEKCIETIYNVPVVCNYDRETDEIGSHDFDIIKDENGNSRYINITQPVGVVPESAQWYWETVNDDGVEHEYLCVEVLLWKRQEAYTKIKNNGITKHSMEITVYDSEFESDGYFLIQDFCFTAFCLLGTANPCFESSCLKMFASNDFSEQFEKMKSELSNLNYQINSTQNINNKLEKEDEKHLNPKDEILKKYSLTSNDIDFDYSEMTDEDFENRVSEIVKTKSFVLTNEQLRHEFFDLLSKEKVNDGEFSYPRYEYVDFDSALSEVYCYDNMDYKLYGFKYSVNGDIVKIDYASKCKKKFAIVDFEGEETEPFEIFSKTVMENSKLENEAKYNKAKEEFESKLFEANNRIASLEAEIEAENLKKYEEEVSEIFDKFNDKLSGVTEFEELKNSSEKLDIKIIEEKCYAILGRKTANFSLKKTSGKVAIIPSTEPEKPLYGGILSKYDKNN